MQLQNPEYGTTESSMRRRPHLALLRAFCLVEAVTLLTLLLVAVPLKHLAGYALAVSVMGPVHGFAFLLFGWMVTQAVSAEDISGLAGGKLVLVACLPFGGIYSWWALR